MHGDRELAVPEAPPPPPAADPESRAAWFMRSSLALARASVGLIFWAVLQLIGLVPRCVAAFRDVPPETARVVAHFLLTAFKYCGLAVCFFFLLNSHPRCSRCSTSTSQPSDGTPQRRDGGCTTAPSWMRCTIRERGGLGGGTLFLEGVVLKSVHDL